MTGKAPAAADARAAPGTTEHGSNTLAARLVAVTERLAQAVRVQRGRAAYRAGLSGMQLSVLELLRSAPADRRRVSALAPELDLTQPTVSEAVGALVRKGLVTAVPAGGRSRRLDLTAEGHETLAATTAWLEPLVQAFAARPAAQQETALATLLDVVADLQRAGVITVSRMCTTCRFFDRSGTVPRCALVDAPLPPAALRVDCPEHEGAA